MICPSCGSEVHPNAQWCAQCGYGSGGAPGRSIPMVAVIGALALALVLAVYLSVSKIGGMAHKDASTDPVRSSLAVGQRVGTEGPFEVFVSEKESPSVRIGNYSDTVLVFSMMSVDGTVYSMRISPFTNEIIEVPVGRYRAEVSDPTGIVRSSKGVANLQSHREYQADFTVGFGGGRDFYIGD